MYEKETKTKPLQVYFDEDVFPRLESKAKELGLSMGGYIRMTVLKELNASNLRYKHGVE